MELDQALTNVAVLGAAGKMGRGISLLLLQELARLDLESTGSAGSGEFNLYLIDSDVHGLRALKVYFQDHLTKYAERNINTLRRIYAKNDDLVSNTDMIRAFVHGALDITYYETGLEAARGSHLIFEAIVENEEVKAKVFSQLAANSRVKPYFLSNTSSIPISVLNEMGRLHNHIIGFHFYNPPVVQKLVELISNEETDKELCSLSQSLADRLNKVIVKSRDIAGFIGNGCFIREVMFALELVQLLSKKYSPEEAIYMVNKVTQDWLVRPMGIFQLLDYVGIDVCHKICRIMEEYLKGEAFNDDLIESMLAAGITGGQHPNGNAKNGFFHYVHNIPTGIYSLPDQKYDFFDEGNWLLNSDARLGKLPEGYLSWKQLQRDPHKNEKLQAYFFNLSEMKTKGALMARSFLLKDHEIAQKLLDDGVAEKEEDINRVMMNGFYHLFGPFNPWIPKAGVLHEIIA